MENHNKFQNLIRRKDKDIIKTKNDVYSLEIKIRNAIKMNNMAELIAIKDDELYETIGQNLKKLLDETIIQKN